MLWIASNWHRLPFISAILVVARLAYNQPDLVPVNSAIQPYLSSEDFTTTSCAVDEGCTSAGRRRLLRFATYTQNVGTTDLHVGSPIGNPLFEFHACHGHYHFKEFAESRLLTTTGTVVAGEKQSFCMLDSVRWATTAPVSAKYDCLDQGIQAGWGDTYSAYLDCQYLDVTGVPAGDYVLELNLNPAHLLPELDYTNNLTTVPVMISALEPVPQNDLCTSASTVDIPGVPINGNTSEAFHDGTGCGSSSDTQDVWFRYTPGSAGSATAALCGSDYNTVLSVHSGCPGTISNMIACNDNGSATGCVGTEQSSLTWPVTGGVTYLLRISGWNHSNGAYRLLVTGPSPTATVEIWNQY